MGQNLTGRCALVTGGARGIGRGIALALARAGADVAVVDWQPEAADTDVIAEIESLGQRAVLFKADVSDRAAVETTLAQTTERLGAIDIAVANAAFSIREPVESAAWEDVKRTIEVTQFGVFHTCQLAAQQMIRQHASGRSGGKIIITGSIHEEIAVPESAAYNMAKTAVNHLARTMASELARHRINVNVINPGWIDTPGERKYATEEELQEIAKDLPWGRMGTPDDIGKAAAFLASDDADYITGASLRIDGGLTLAWRSHK